MPSSQAAPPIVFSVSEFVDLLNQTLEFAYPYVTIVGELSGFRISKNRWVYFELKDENSSVKCFGSVYMLPAPLEDGMMLQIAGTPRLHTKFGFSINLQSITPVGEGTLKRAATLLEAKLRAEGLFADERKRSLPYPPSRIGLITSGQSAAYADFVKVLSQRWGGVEVSLADVQVQGDQAPGQLIRAIEHFNQLAEPPEILVMIRGGGSIEDLSAFNSELLVRAVASSRIPTLIAIGHEVDVSLAEMAADKRASTPSNAAELLSPDKQRELEHLSLRRRQADNFINQLIQSEQRLLYEKYIKIVNSLHNKIMQTWEQLESRKHVLMALAPDAILKRGYSIVRFGNKVISSGRQLKAGQSILIQLKDASANAQIKSVELKQ